MRILLVQDEGLRLDLDKCSRVLNDVCHFTRFSVWPKAENIGQDMLSPDILKEVRQLQGRLSGNDTDYTLYITMRRYRDNWFFHATANVMILSFFAWNNYTTLPIENGLFYFVADELALRIDRSFRHADTTGCIYDFLTNKTAVDLGMKMGSVCETCRRRLTGVMDRSKEKRNMFIDLAAILEVVGGCSKWGKNVIDFEKNVSLKHLDWATFEDEVAQLFRAIGASVKQNVSLSGFQIDVYVEEVTPSGQKFRVAVDCKLHKAKVGNLAVNDFARIVETLKGAKLADKGTIVSYSGFSKDAYTVSEKTGITLLTLEDLKQSVSRRKGIPVDILEKETVHMIESRRGISEARKARQPEVFVIMPFSSDFEDTYHLGIHEVVTELGCLCRRSDEVEFVGDVMSKIYELINNAQLIIGEVSVQNANVYYELGYAHALHKPVILLTKDISSAPFDIRGQNHIVYKKIVELREKLRDRLSSIL